MKHLQWTIALGLSALIGAAQAATFGEQVPLGKPLPLGDALKAPPEGNTLFSGRVVEVCQKKGCWAMLEDEGRAVRLMMHEHAFSVPQDYRGPAVVWGVMEEVEMSESMARHLAEDAGRSEPVERREYRIDTLGIRLTGEGG
ncbi:DUF4920 domain-containing protein [Pseudomarimonas salicorniae]|uniref:DUF4920 domain-containing protein n=1 Tax=Pseudomarimonas salicorniae TaxID=2933270 RepID=A0ABT0GL70_9GAMM|nr:DUF4920 domain-containing protein [Lysobacter sp. CAU 1642]MCK7595284.1 DUF4920 domain-containing protein [Lysobacter sp. CAU 1642]